MVIARSGGGINESFTVRKISYGEGVERVFPVHSPYIAEIEVIRRGKVRRAKLYYLRGRRGKSARIFERTDARAKRLNAAFKGFKRPKGEADDLTRIKGLGADLAAQLNGLGVIKFDQIANFSDDDIANVDETLSLGGRIEKEDWVRQAQAFVAEAAAAEVPAADDRRTRRRAELGPFCLCKDMAQHVGIVACSAEGAALCYRTICVEGAQFLGVHAHPEISMHTHSLAEYMACIYRGDWRGVGELMLASANKLATIGADFLICPDNTIHQALPHIEPRSPLPWLHIAEVVATEAAARGYRRLGLTGTRWLLDSAVYPDKLVARGLEFVRPDTAECEEINRIIMDELVCGVFRPEAIAYHQGVIGRMKEKGCDAVVLGCTEIPLIINDANSPLPTLNSTRLLARAALRRAAQGGVT